MIPEEVPAVGEEDPGVVDEDDAVEGVYGEAPPVDEYRLSSRPGVVGGPS
jgi:hypothetical protein